MTAWYNNAELERYFKDEAVPNKNETKRIIEILKPDLDMLFQFIKKHDPRLHQQVAHVGSYYQGLKVRRSDEFDYSLCLDISTQWVVSRGGGLYYGFKGYDTDEEHRAHTIQKVYTMCFNKKTSEVHLSVAQTN